MQLQKEKEYKPLHIRHSYCCVDCRYNWETDIGKCIPVHKPNGWRILLVPLTNTIFICPKCGKQHLLPSFINNPKEYAKAQARKREVLKQKREENLQKIYGREELERTRRKRGSRASISS